MFSTAFDRPNLYNKFTFSFWSTSNKVSKSMLSMLVWKEGLHALKWKHFQMKMYQSGRA